VYVEFDNLNTIEIENVLLSDVYSNMSFNGVYLRDRLYLIYCIQHRHKQATWKALGGCTLWLSATWELFWQLRNSAVHTQFIIYEHPFRNLDFNDTVLQARFLAFVVIIAFIFCCTQVVGFTIWKCRDFLKTFLKTIALLLSLFPIYKLMRINNMV